MDTLKHREQPSIDPLRRVLVPIEKRTSDGFLVLQTLDGEKYFRDKVTGAIRGVQKMNGKQSKRLRAKVRRQRG